MYIQTLALPQSLSAVEQMNSSIHVKKTPRQKFADLAKSLFKEQHWLMTMAYRQTIEKPRSEYVDCSKPIQWKASSKGLYVLVHGLRGHPSHWTRQLKILKEQQPACDVIAPFVYKKGDCTLEEAALPILEKICDYIKTHPNKPICLIGVSNGGRIVTWLETELRLRAPTTPVKVSAVAGVHFGTHLVSKFGSWPIVKTLIGSEKLREELAYGSPKAQELLGKVRKDNAQHHLRDYDFYATAEDLCVGVDSALPLVSNAHYYLVHGEGHNTIVEAIASHQIKSCQEWMTFVHAQ